MDDPQQVIGRMNVTVSIVDALQKNLQHEAHAHRMRPPVRE
jgi:hypothetical protein